MPNPYPPLTPEELTRQLANERANVAVLVEAGRALLDAAERHIFGDECLAERTAFRAALSSVEGGR